jgi:hypothetical protein
MNVQIILKILVVWLSILTLPMWFYLWHLPQMLHDVDERRAEREKPTVEEYIEQGYDTYEYEGDWGEHRGDHDDQGAMPGPMLECEQGDHACID